MSNNPTIRFTIIAEDNRTKDFVVGLLARLFGNRRTRVSTEVAPSGKGDAADYVLSVTPARIAKHRQYGRENRALIIAVDGDNLGFSDRSSEISRKLDFGSVSFPSKSERIVFLIPTWSIETWLLRLAFSKESLREDQKSKREFENLLTREFGEKEVRHAAIEAWGRPNSHETLPSLLAAVNEMQRLGELL